MTGSSPKPSPRPPRNVKRRRPVQSNLPVTAILALFAVYALIGLLLSFPVPPIWIWIPAAVGTILLTIGLNRPMATGNASDKLGFFTYVGALLLVIALAIAANYIGGEDGFKDVGFFQAIFGLAALTILAVALAAGAAITSAQSGALLMRTREYNSSLSIVLGTSFLAILLGALIGFAIASLVATAS